ncbi:hypothetical protein E2562_030430 [Oryza meyeriana var. granulata]|uniref:Uncharacterized protein n=1 Tax=Oryza meyeriana var. granulata TaxID=110450 RepID=A0A6G1FE03_9ORYZ|nr:hypothetical protein E2562_030430 [Oryza meyeriana var. granulata]
MGNSLSSVGSNDTPPPPPLLWAPPPARGGRPPRCCCPYCLDGPSRGSLRSHLRRHYREVVKGRALGGLTPRARLAVLHAAAFRDSRDARRRIRRNQRPRGMMVPLSPNYAFWAAHRWRGTRPVEIDFLGLGLHGTGMPAAPAAAGASDGGSAQAPADDREESVAEAEADVNEDRSSAGSNWQQA